MAIIRIDTYKQQVTITVDYLEFTYLHEAVVRFQDEVHRNAQGLEFPDVRHEVSIADDLAGLMGDAWDDVRGRGDPDPDKKYARCFSHLAALHRRAKETWDRDPDSNRLKSAAELADELVTDWRSYFTPAMLDVGTITSAAKEWLQEHSAQDS